MSLSLFLACGKDDPESQAKKDRQILLKYISDNDLDAHEVDDTGVFYVINKEGSGGFPTADSHVHVKNEGYYFNDDEKLELFQPLTTNLYHLRNMILGWQIGIPKFNRGAKGLLLIPSGYGYGPYSYYTGVPPNSVLLYEVEIEDFN